ncbi:hypothetical protein GCM10027080_37000 [Pedococcus soli]
MSRRSTAYRVAACLGWETTGADNDGHEHTRAVMSSAGGPEGRPQLDDLVERARAGLRDWTDRTDHDPGVALLELFAFVGELLASHADRIADEAYLGEEGRAGLDLGDGVHGRRPPGGRSISARYRQGGGYVAVRQQQGRVPLDGDVVEEPPRPAIGVHRAVVVNNIDPLLRSRLLVSVPDVTVEDGPVWAVACLPATVPSAEGGEPPVPAVGDGVWVAFEGGDPSFPVWLGRNGG